MIFHGDSKLIGGMLVVDSNKAIADARACGYKYSAQLAQEYAGTLHFCPDVMATVIYYTPLAQLPALGVDSQADADFVADFPLDAYQMIGGIGRFFGSRD